MSDMINVRYYNESSGAWEAVEGTDGAMLVSITGADVSITAPSAETITATPVVGAQTATAVASELFAGAAALSGRKQLNVRNDDPILRVRVGPAGVTQQSGFPLEPGAVMGFRFDGATYKAIYKISEGAAAALEVWES